MANVLNRTTLQYLKSVNTPDYDPADWIINPDLSAVNGVPKKYWKISGNSVLEMTPQEKSDKDQELANTPTNIPQTKNIKTIETSKGLKSKETWYATDNGDGTYTGIAEEIIYNYSGKKLISIETKTYDTNGFEITPSKVSYFFNNNNLIVQKDN